MLFDFQGLTRRSEGSRNNTIVKYGGVAQLGEHLPCKQGVMGSNPIISTKEGKTSGTRDEETEGKLNGLIAQVVRARA